MIDESVKIARGYHKRFYDLITDSAEMSKQTAFDPVYGRYPLERRCNADEVCSVHLFLKDWASLARRRIISM